MLTKIRDGASSWIAKTLVWGVALTFVGSAFFIWGDASQKNQPIAVVDGEEISVVQLRRMVSRIEQNMRDQFGGQVDSALLKALNVPQMAIDSLVSRAIQKRAARAAGFAVSDAELTAAIGLEESFQVDGIFNNARYFEALKLNGLDVARFEYGVREDLLMQKLRTSVVRSAVVTENEVLSRYLYENQKIKAAYATLSVAKIGNSLAPSKEVIATYYSEEGEQFLTPEARSFRVLRVDNEPFADRVTVTSEQEEDYYSRHIDEYLVPESVKVRHILFKVDAEDSDDEKEAAMKKATSTYDRLEAGEKFAALAKELSEGPTAATGGDMGRIKRGEMVPQFEEVAFSLEAGKYAQPFLSSFGWHIVKVMSKNAGSIPSLDDVRDEISDGVRREGARTEARAFIEGLAKVATADSFAALSDKDPQVKINSYSVTKGDEEKEAAHVEALAKLAFTLPVNHVSEPEVVEGGFALVMVDNITEPATPPLRKIRKAVLSAWRRDEGLRIAEERATEIEAAVNSGQSLAAATKSEGLTVKLSKPFSRTTTGDTTLSFREALDLAMGKAVVVNRNNNFYVVTVVERLLSEKGATTSELSELKKKLQQQKEEGLYNAFVTAAREEAEAKGMISINLP